MIARLRRVAEGLFAVLERAVTSALYPWRALLERLGAPARVPILMYHQVGRPVEGVPATDDCVAPETFERQMRAILRAGYEVVPLPALIERLRCGGPALPRRAVVLTFDDGLRGQFVSAYPVLRRLRLPATFFVVPGYIGGYTFYPHLGLDEARVDPGSAPPLAWLPLSWDEVAEMRRNGMTIGSHSMSHRSLGRLDPAEAEFEARRSREILEQRLAEPVDLFAYPFGSRVYGDFDPGLEEMLRRTGYSAACTTTIARCAPGVDRFALPRVPMQEDDSPFRVRCKLAGAYDWVGAVKWIAQSLLERRDRVDAGIAAGLPCGRA